MSSEIMGGENISLWIRFEPIVKGVGQIIKPDIAEWLFLIEIVQKLRGLFSSIFI